MPSSLSKFFALFLALPLACAFSSFLTGSSSIAGPTVTNRSTLRMEYIPSGMSKEQWRQMKEQEKAGSSRKNLGKVGITTFKSRTFADWQKDGGNHLFPVNPKTVKNVKDIPYMQRPGGVYDDSDLTKKPFGMFGNNKQKKQVDEQQEKPTTNWWTL